MGSGRRPGGDGPQSRSHQAGGPWTAGPAHARVPEGPAGQPGGPGERPARQRPDHGMLRRRNAAHDDLPGAGIRGHPGGHLHPARRQRQPAPRPDRWPRLAGQAQSDLSGLLDRPLGRQRRRRHLRRAGGRDPRPVQGSARLRRYRFALTLRQQLDVPGALLHRQGGSQSAARRDHDRRSRADATLDGGQDLPPQRGGAAGLAGGILPRHQSPARARQRELSPER